MTGKTTEKRAVRELCEYCEIEIFEYGKDKQDFKIVKSICPRCGREGQTAIPIFRKVKA